MNRAYEIRRENMLTALREAGIFVGMGNKLPVGESAGEQEVRVRIGCWLPRWGENHPSHAHSFYIRLTVRVTPSGVANRIQAKCPECGRWMRFSGLQQHVGTLTCRKAADRARYAASRGGESW